MLNAISLVIEQRKTEFDRIAKGWFSPSIVIPCEGDIASTKNLLVSIKPIICKLNYSHVIKLFISRHLISDVIAIEKT